MANVSLRVFSLVLLLVPPITLYAVPAHTVVATIPVGITPGSLAVTPDSRYAYVANSNNYEDPGSDTVSVIDLATNLPVLTIADASFNQPWRIAINAAGTRAYVCNSNACTVSVLDIATNSVIAVIAGFDGPSGFVITPDGQFGYVNNYGAPCGVGSGNGTTLRKVDLNINAIVGPPIVVNQAPAALAISPDGAFVYSVNYVDGNVGTGTINIISTATDMVVGTIPGFSGPFGIALTPDGRFAYVTNFGSNNFFPYGTTVSVVDLNLSTIVATVNLAIQPAGIDITPDGRYAYVSNYNTLYASGPMAPYNNLTPGQGTIQIIDIATNTVIPPVIAVDQSPNAVVIEPRGLFAYVTNYIANTVNVIALQSFQLAVTGCKTRNIFLTQEDLINRLTITATGTALPVRYSVYRDAQLTDLIATVPATSNPQIFLDHNRQLNVNDTYYIVGTNAVGTSSAPVSVTISQTC